MRQEGLLSNWFTLGMHGLGWGQRWKWALSPGLPPRGQARCHAAEAGAKTETQIPCQVRN